jgi:hypothetical protein
MLRPEVRGHIPANHGRVPAPHAVALTVYGMLTVVPSPVAVIVNVPAASEV